MKKPRAINKIGRKRRAAGWVMLTLGVVVAGVWVWSLKNGLSVRVGRCGLTFSAGVVSFGWPTRESFVEPRNFRIEVFAELGGDPWQGTWIPAVDSSEIDSSWRLLHFASHYTRSDKVSGRHICSHWRFVVWPIPLLLWAAGVPVLRSGILARRRAMTGACPKCGYSLAGLAADAACPECGKQKTGLG